MIHVSHADVPTYCEDADEDAAIEAAGQAAKKAPAKPPTAERPKGRKRDAEEAAEAPEEAPRSAKKGRGGKKGGKWAIIHSKDAHDTCNMSRIHVSRRDLHVLCVPVFRLYYTVY